LALFDGEIEKQGDFYTEAICFRLKEIEDSDLYNVYEYSIPITNKKLTFEIIGSGPDNKIVSGIDSYIYIYLEKNLMT
jgi:hypothetical protein